MATQLGVVKYLSDARFTKLLTLPDGSVVSYADVGTPTGFPVIFIPGSSGHRLWVSLCDQLARDRGLRLLCFDRPGRGLSTPSLQWKAWDYESWTATFMEICQQLHLDRFILLAHSTGSMYALNLYQALRECIVGPLRLISPWLPTNLPCMPSTYAVRRSLPVSMVRNMRALASVNASLFPGSSWQIGSVSAREAEYLTVPLIRHVLSILAQDDADMGYVAYEVDWLLALEMTRPMGRDVRTFTAPILCWHGVDDAVIPLGSVLWAQREMPAFKVNAIAKGKHNLLLDLDVMALVFDDVMQEVRAELRRQMGVGADEVGAVSSSADA
jgi:pimeloyl-ACP methyl ester carboxylesterase